MVSKFMMLKKSILMEEVKIFACHLENESIHKQTILIR